MSFDSPRIVFAEKTEFEKHVNQGCVMKGFTVYLVGVARGTVRPPCEEGVSLR